MIHAALSWLKYRLLAPMPPKLYWTLMGRFRTVPAVTSQYTSLEDSFDSGERVVAMFDRLGLLRHDATTLHIGCGIGRIEYHLCKRVMFCYGIDIAPSMIQQARKNVRATNVRFLCVDGTGLADFDDCTFDLIYALFVFQHLPREVVRTYFRDSFDKLVQGGKFAFQLMVDDTGSRREPPSTHPYGLRYYTRRDVLDQLEKAGFRDVAVFDFESSGPERGPGPGDLFFVAMKPIALN